MKFEFLTLNYKPCPEDEKPARFGFECPKRTGHMCTGLLIDGATHNDGSRIEIRNAMWKWNNNRERPTFTPSINCSNCGWHGYITNGVAK